MDTIVDLSDERMSGMHHLQAKSGEALPRIVAELRKLRQEPALPPLVQNSTSPMVADLSPEEFCKLLLADAPTPHDVSAPNSTLPPVK